MREDNTMKSKEITFNGSHVVAYDDGSIETFRRGKTSSNGRGFGRQRPDGYMRRWIRSGGVYIHRVIAKAFLDDYSEDRAVDHINGDKTDNRPANLRMVTHKQNCRAFRRKCAGASSKYRGVSWHKKKLFWQAYIQPSGRMIHLGQFDAEEEAARAYNRAAIKLQFPEEALNDVPGVCSETDIGMWRCV